MTNLQLVNWTSALRTPKGILGLTLVGIVILLGLFAPLIASYGPLQQIPGENLISPNGAHLLGTDELSRDIFARTIFGIRETLLVIVIAVPIGGVIGTIIGLAATVNTWVDSIIQRGLDVVLAFPSLFLAITIAAINGPGIGTVIAAIIITELPIFARLVRSQVLTIRQQPYVESAAAIGAPPGWILRHHILPNSLAPLWTQLALSLSLAVFIESSMSFIGIGIRPPQPSLGSLTSDAIASLNDNPWFAVAPLSIIVALALGFLLIAQSLSQDSHDK